MTARSKICGALLLVLFVGHLAGMSLFYHTHIVQGGAITHSHFYSGTSQNPGHGHGLSQLVQISLLSITLLIAASARVAAFAAARRAERFVGADENAREESLLNHNVVRGPPVAA